MKLTNLLPISSEQQVMEGVTFGRSQMNMVQQSGNVLVGIEYEFTLDDAQLGDEDARQEFIENKMDELREQYMDELREKHRGKTPDTSEATNVIFDAISETQNILDYIATVEAYIDLGEDSAGDEDVNDLGEEEYNELTDALQNIAVALDNLSDAEYDVDNLADEIDESFGGFRVYNTTITSDDLYEMSSAIGKLPDFSDLTSVDDPFASDSFDGQDEVFETYINQGAMRITENISTDTFTTIAKSELSKSRIELAMQEQIDYWVDEESEEEYDRDYARIVRHEAEQEADEFYPEGGMDNHDHAERAEHLLDDYRDVMDKIERVYPDGPAPLAEAVGQAMPIDESMEHMYDMLDFIKEHGYTDERAGMHVNISLSDNDMEMDDLNPTKLVMLMNDGYVDHNFPEREYTGPVFNSFDSQKLITIVENMVAANANPDIFDEGVVKEIERMVKRGSNISGKGTNFNISGVTGEPNPSKRRVEFRYFGGVIRGTETGYEHRGEEMEFEIHRAAYSLMAAFDEDFLRREYIESLWNFVDDQMERVFGGRGISDLYKWIKYAKENFDEDTFDEVLSDVRNNPRNIELIFQNADRSARGKQETDLDPQQVVSKLVNANARDIYEITDEYFDTLISVIEQTRASTLRSLAVTLQRSSMFAWAVSSEEKLLALNDVISGEININDRYAQSVIRDISGRIAAQWLEEEGDRDMLKRFDRNEVHKAATVAIAPHVEDFIDRGNRTLEELHYQIDFVRLS